MIFIIAIITYHHYIFLLLTIFVPCVKCRRDYWLQFITNTKVCVRIIVVRTLAIHLVWFIIYHVSINLLYIIMVSPLNLIKPSQKTLKNPQIK